MDYLLVLTLGLLFNTQSIAGNVLEKSTSACNGPCGQISASCPAGHRLAIRDLLYRVQYKTSSCKPAPGCNDVKQEVCCDTKPDDCVFPYSIPELQTQQRSCSAISSCVLQTRYPELQKSKCAPSGQQQVSSYTVMSYICINDSSISDMCSTAQIVITGRTLFAIADPRKSKNLTKGSVCTCKAESVAMSSSDTIAVFAVDLRLNTNGANTCSNSSFSVRSGGNTKDVDCVSSQDPGISYPFVVMVNDSNVINSKLQIQNSPPELVWIGFESNLNEDIRLTCQLQNAEPSKAPIPDNTHSRNNNEAVIDTPVTKKEIRIPAIIGGVVAGIVLIIIVIVIILVCKKKLTCPGSSKPLGAEHDAQVDFDYYSTPDEELKKLEAVQTTSARSSTSSAQDLYISPEEVRAKKSQNPKRLSQVSVKEFEDEDEYVTTFEIQHRKRMSRNNKKTEAGNENLPSTTTADDREYDRLDCRLKRPNDEVMNSYDRLAPESVKTISLELDGPIEPRGSVNGGHLNLAYEETELIGDSARSTLVLRPVKSPGLDSSSGYSKVQDIFPREDDSAPDIRPKTSSISSPMYDVPRKSYQEYDTPTQLKLREQSEQANNVQKPKLNIKKENSNTIETDLSDDKKIPEVAVPVAAPRRKRKSIPQPYDIAKPIQ